MPVPQRPIDVGKDKDKVVFEVNLFRILISRMGHLLFVDAGERKCNLVLRLHSLHGFDDKLIRRSNELVSGQDC